MLGSVDTNFMPIRIQLKSVARHSIIGHI